MPEAEVNCNKVKCNPLSSAYRGWTHFTRYVTGWTGDFAPAPVTSQFLKLSLLASARERHKTGIPSPFLYYILARVECAPTSCSSIRYKQGSYA